MAAAGARVDRRAASGERAAAAWLATAAASFIALPWFFNADRGLLEQLAAVWTVGDGASGLVEAIRGGRPWLAVVPLGLVVAVLGIRAADRRRRGALLVAGAATPLAAGAVTGVMTMAIHKVHLAKGPWVSDGGYEYNAVLMAAVFAITAAGPGPLALDKRRWGTGWAMAQLAAGAGGALAMVKLSERAMAREPQTSTGRFTQPAADAEPIPSAG